MARTEHYKTEVARLAADRLRERESRLAQIRVAELAGDQVNDDERGQVEEQIKALEKAAKGEGE